MPIETAAAVGVPAKTAWSTTATLRSPQGELYMAAGFSGTDLAPHAGRDFIDQLQAQSQSFRDAASVYQFFQDYWQSLNGEVAASLAVLWRQGSAITLLTFGFGQIALLRGDGGRWLMNGEKEQQVLEGQLREGDRVMLATARTSDLELPFEMWSDFLVQDVADELAVRLRKFRHASEVAVLVVGQVAVPEPSLVQVQQEQRVEPDKQTQEVRQVVAEQEGVAQGKSAPRISNQVHQPRINTAVSPDSQAQSDPEPAVSNPAASSNTQHLISPTKLAAGIVADKAEVSARSQQQRHRRAGAIWQVMQRLSWVRLVVVVVVVSAVIGGLTLWRYRNIRQEYQEVVAPLEQRVNELLSFDETQRLAQRDEANSLLERLSATRVEFAANRRQVEALRGQVESLYENVSGEREAMNIPVFFDFRLAVANFLATRAARYEDTAVFMDANEQKLISLNLNSKNNETATSEFVGGGRDLTVWGREAFVLRGDDVSRVPTSGANAEVLASLADDATDPAFVDSFGDNLYVLDKGGSQLWRLERAAEASPSAWVRSAPGVDFGSISSLSIDGDVWIGSNEGNIFRLRRGERIEFTVQGLLEPFTSTLLVAVSEGGEKLVVVEPAKQRLVVLNKEDGVYQQQLQSEQLGGVTDVFLNDDESIAYLVAGSVVYRVEL